MNIIFEKQNNDLVVYIHTRTAADQDILNEKLHVHSEYDTKYSNKLAEWLEAKYYTWDNYETMRGHETCITILRFIKVSSVDEFIIDINTYLRK